MELTSIHHSPLAAAPKLQRKPAQLAHHPLQLRYALAAAILSMMGAHISADFEEHPSPEKSLSQLGAVET